MSVLYSIIAIDEELTQEKNDFWAQLGIEIPMGTTSRYPTPSEIRQALNEMTEYTKDYFITEKAWDVDIYETASYDQKLHRIDGKYATIYSIGPALSESLPLPIYFHGGWEEVNLEIVLRLTYFTGPLMIMCDVDTVPLLVSPGAELTDLLSRWKKQREIARLSSGVDDITNIPPSPGKDS